MNVYSNNVFQNWSNKNSKIGDVVLTTKHGIDVILDPWLNKGTSFPYPERERLGIRGLLPSGFKSLDSQILRIEENYRTCKTNLEKYIFLIQLLDRNEVLFYTLLSKNIKEFAPIIYTPTVAEACIHFGGIFKRPRGMYFSSNDIGEMKSMIYNWHTDDVELIVVTDGSRIWGWGDWGANGMGIPIGKLCLYTACGGIHPSKCWPVVIDVGTNNESLLKSEHNYLGLKQKRISGKKFYDIMDEFMTAVYTRYPNALVQFEDFSSNNATALLNKYRNKYLCFNDDMQGTSVVTLAAILNALHQVHHEDPMKLLTKQKIIVAGAGTAGLGVAQGIWYNMVKSGGISEEEAYKRFYIVDDKGCLGSGRNVQFFFQKNWVRNDIKDKLDLLSLIKQVKPTIIIGLTGQGGWFNENIIREMAKHCEHPIIFPMSNPTKNAECTAKDAYEWTDGRCVFASGSPFKPISFKGKFNYISQANNMYSFPGIGLGGLISQSKSITDNMLNAAAIAWATSTRKFFTEQGSWFPSINNIPEISKDIAVAVGLEAVKEGICGNPSLKTSDDIRKLVNDNYWDPKYGQLCRVDPLKL